MRTMALLASTIMVFGAHHSSAQWVRTSGPAGGRAEALLTTPSSILLGLEGGAIYRTTDHGSTWTLSVDALSNVSDGCAGFALTRSAVLTATYSSGVFRSTDDGRTWSAANSGLSNAAKYVGAIAAMGDTVVICTSGDGIYRSTNGAGSWTKSNTGMPVDTLFETLAACGTAFFAGSDNGGGIFASTDAGQTWFRASGGLSGESRNIQAFAMTGSSLIAGTRQGAYWSVDNGMHWTLCSSGLTSRAVATLWAAGTDLFAGTYGSGVYRSSNNGIAWVQTSVNMNLNVRALTSAGSNLFAGTYGPGTLYRSSDLGTTWTVASAGIACEGVSSLVVHGGKLHAIGFDGLLQTTNQGSTWMAADSSLPTGSLYSILARSSDLFAGTTGKGVYRSTDGGTKWFVTSSGLGGSSLTVWSIAAEGSDLYTGTGGGVFRSTDNGGSWTQSTQGIPDSVIRRMAASNGTIYAGTFSSLYRSTNNGQLWTASTSGLPQYFQPEVFAVSDSFVFVGMFSGIYRTSDRGAAWVKVSDGLPASPDVRSLTMVPLTVPEAKVLYAGLSHGGIYGSSNAGISWFPVGAGMATGVNVLSLATDLTRLYAGTYGHGVWKRPISEMLVAVRDNPVEPSGAELEQNFPNPFNGISNFEIRIAKSTWVTLSVYDILGREMAILVHEQMEPGTHLVTFDASGLATGVYVCRLEAGGGVASRKIVLLR